MHRISCVVYLDTTSTNFFDIITTRERISFIIPNPHINRLYYRKYVILQED
jgi:hypothetical protein